MLNSLANHGYLPRDGSDISMDVLVAGLKAGVNLGADATKLVGATALKGSTTGNASTFHLTDLYKHGCKTHRPPCRRMKDLYTNVASDRT
jgi:hypothetical protein